MKHTTQEFTDIHPVAHEVLTKAGFMPVPCTETPDCKGKFHVTAPWTWHRHGDGWQFYLHLKDAVHHFFEDRHGMLHHD